MKKAPASATPSLHDPFAGYGAKGTPLPEYMALVAAYGTLVAGLVALVRQRELSARLGLGELLLLGFSTHKLSRLVSKDRVTSPFRAPFAKFVKSDGPGEVEEEARGTGWRKALGDLVTCPFCVSPWAALGLIALLLLAPRAGRVLCGILTSVAVSHFLHHAYVALDNHQEPT